MKKENLWGSINLSSNDITPLSFLKEQADKLSETTKNMFKASITTDKQNFDYNLTMPVNHIETTIPNPKDIKYPFPAKDFNLFFDLNTKPRDLEYFHHSFRVLVPKLDYSFVLLTLTHETFTLKPFKVYSHIDHVLRNGNSIDDLENILKEIIKSPKVANSLSNLLLQAK